MKDKIKQLRTSLAEISDLTYVKTLLDWDQETNMPVAGATGRPDQSAALAKIIHLKSTDQELGQLLDNLLRQADSLDPDSDDACLIRFAHHQFDKQRRVPPAWVEAYTHAISTGQSVWQKARKQSDFSLFRPQLEKIVDLARQYAGFFAPYRHIYDPFLDDYERGLTTTEVQSIFSVLRENQVTLIKTISEKQQVEDEFLFLNYDRNGQWDFGVEAMTAIGFEWERGRQDTSAHPFTNSMGFDDVRITTRFYEDNLASALFSSLHECGHALYELGLDDSLRRTPLATGASMALHESQSRLWENLVGRSRPFWQYFFPRLQRHFPEQLKNIDAESFYRAVNRVQPSFIRVESDETTYNLHIMLRLELEIALLEGSLEVKDLPQAWNNRMQDYLGLTPSNDAEGVLQDVHWSAGLFGYFPTYALGNLISAQIWECMMKEIPDIDDQMVRGEFHNLLGWLRSNIHRHGSKYEPQALVRRITGTGIEAAPYLRYLNRKFGDIYGF